MKFTLTVERYCDPDDGELWSARIAELPDVCGFDADAAKAASIAVEAAVYLTQKRDASSAGESL